MTEIFVEPELEQLQQPEVAEEWKQLVIEMNMRHQLVLVTAASDDTEKTPPPPPYMVLDVKTQNIIRALCPERVEYNEYSAGTIPLDILQEIKKCVDAGWYQKIYIFSDNTTPDPFVVGRLKSDDSAWHLIGRWGAELIPFELLESKAIERLRTNMTKEYKKVLAQVTEAVANMDDTIRARLEGTGEAYLYFPGIRSLSW